MRKNILLFLFAFHLLNGIAQPDDYQIVYSDDDYKLLGLNKSFQLIVKYFDTQKEDTFEIPRIEHENYWHDKSHNAYHMIIEDLNAGPYRMYSLGGNFKLELKKQFELYFGFSMSHSYSFRADYAKPENNYTIFSVNYYCDPQDKITKPEFLFHIKGDFLDVFEYKVLLCKIEDVERGFTLELKVKD